MTIHDAGKPNDWANFDKIPGWFSQKEAVAMQAIVRQLPHGARVVELGSFQGRSSVVIASVLPENGILYCVDHFKGSLEHQQGDYELNRLFEKFRHNIESANVDDKIRILAMNSLEAAELFADQSVDMVFVDASHDYDSVRADILRWYQKIKVEGVLLCHDYTPLWQDVMDAIKSLEVDGEVLDDNLWLHQKLQHPRAELNNDYQENNEHIEVEQDNEIKSGPQDIRLDDKKNKKKRRKKRWRL